MTPSAIAPSRPIRLRAAADLPPLDVAIIRALQDDGRTPYAAMARDLGVDEKTVRRRVQDLIGRGVIAITTVADPPVLGYGSGALVAVRVDPSRAPSDVADELAELPESDHVVVTTGRYDVFVELMCRNADELHEAIEQRVRTVAGVARCETFPYLGRLYQEPEWTTAQAKRDDGRPPHRPVALDRNDLAILAILSDDGRTPFPRIAAAIGMSEAQVRQRVNAMVRQRIVRIMAITNPTSLGYRTSAWLAITAAPGAAAGPVAERLAAVPSIAYLALCAGRYALFAEAVCESEQDLLRILDEEVRPLEGVQAVEPAIFQKIHYKRLRPLI